MKSVRFELDYEVPMGEAELTYNLAAFAAEGFVAPARIRLEVTHRTDTENHALIIEGHDEPFDAVVRVFTSLLTRQFGDGKFKIMTSVNTTQSMTAVA